MSSGQLAQLVERGADKCKVVCSRLIRTSLHILFGLASILSSFCKFVA